MTSAELIEIFDSKVRIKLSLAALSSALLLAAYIVFGSAIVSAREPLANYLIIGVLSVLCSITILMYVTQLRSLKQASKWLAKDVPNQYAQFRTMIAEASLNIEYCEKKFSNDFHHSLIEAKTLLLKAKKIVSELRYREKRVSKLIGKKNIHGLLSSHLLMNHVVGEQILSHNSLTSTSDFKPIPADKVKEELEDLFLSIQTKIGIAKDATKRAADSILRQQALTEQDIKNMKELSKNKEDSSDEDFQQRRKKLLESLRKKSIT